MEKNELFDAILAELAEDEKDFTKLSVWAEKHLQYTNTLVIDEIVEEIVEKGWGQLMKDRADSIRLIPKGKEMLREHKSYSGFLQSEKDKENKINTSERNNRNIKNGGIIAGIIGVMFGIVYKVYESYSKTPPSTESIEDNSHSITHDSIPKDSTSIKAPK
jgi:hypothetical protein